jgi:hypothetical protein
MPGDELSLTLRSVREVGRLALTGTLLSVLIPSMDRDLTSRYVTRLYHSTKCSSNEDRHITRCDCVALCVCMCVFVYEYIRIYLSTTE